MIVVSLGIYYGKRFFNRDFNFSVLLFFVIILITSEILYNFTTYSYSPEVFFIKYVQIENVPKSIL